jgi:hypothetical protein
MSIHVRAHRAEGLRRTAMRRSVTGVPPAGARARWRCARSAPWLSTVAAFSLAEWFQ